MANDGSVHSQTFTSTYYTSRARSWENKDYHRVSAAQPTSQSWLEHREEKLNRERCCWAKRQDHTDDEKLAYHIYVLRFYPQWTHLRILNRVVSCYVFVSTKFKTKFLDTTEIIYHFN